MRNDMSQWQTESLTRSFLDGVRRAIPGADLQLSVIAKIVQSWRPDPQRILDLGCGDGILGRMLLDLFPDAEGVFADFSEPMMAAAREKRKESSSARFVLCDFSSPDWRKEPEFAEPIDIVVSGFAIHHQPDERKKALYGEIYSLLSSGGLFLNLEHVSSATPEISTLFDDYFIDSLQAFHQSENPAKTREEIATTYYNRPDKVENILAPVDRQCKWLREIGFQDVDCFFKVFELALFGGRKNE